MGFLFDRHFWFGVVLGAFSYLFYFFIVQPIVFVGGLLLKLIPFLLRAAIFLLVLWGMGSCVVSLL